MMRINNWIGGGVGDEAGTAQQFETFSFQWTLNLQEGDEIWLKISLVSTDTYLWGAHYTHFSGSLLEEKIAFA